MIGWFVAAESGECDDCGCKTKRNDRIYYETHDTEAARFVVDKRLCVECAP